MVNADINVWDEVNIKRSHQITDGYYYKVNQPKKGIDYFNIFYQNIRGLGKKARELLSHLHPDFPHVLCLTKHHLKDLQLEKVHIENYKSGVHYCRQLHIKKGGVAIFVHNSLGFSNTGIDHHCKEQDIEICALKLSFGTLNICVLTLYRAPSGNFSIFVLNLNTILQSLYTPMLHFIICGDININYLNDSVNKSKQGNLLLSYNLTGTINFPARVHNTSATTIDNIVIDASQFERYTVTPIINGVSDHNAQLLIISADYSHIPTLFFFLRRYNFREVLAFSPNSFHLGQFLMQSFQFVVFIFVVSLFTSSSHLFLGLPSDLVSAGAHSYTFFTMLLSGIRCTCPNQADLCALM